MANLDPDLAQDWISDHLNPNGDQRRHLLQHVFHELNQDMSVCHLTSKQKYSVLCQGVTTISDMDILGPRLEDIRSMFKVFNSLSDRRGGVNFGDIHYQRILVLVMYAKDKKRRGQVVDAA
eukprot:4519908-Ditylum_brightwellii.AAC.1